jgi:hypothetical protein
VKKTLILLRKQNKTTSFHWACQKAIHIMGVLAAKEAVKAYNIPMVPGLDEAHRY